MFRTLIVEIDQDSDGCQQLFAGRSGGTLTEQLRRIVTIVGVFQRLTRKSGQFQCFQIRILLVDWHPVQRCSRHWFSVHVIDAARYHTSGY